MVTGIIRWFKGWMIRCLDGYRDYSLV